MSWISNNIASIGVFALVILLVGALVRSLFKMKKQGKSPCSACSGCAFAEKCRGNCEKQ